MPDRITIFVVASGVAILVAIGGPVVYVGHLLNKQETVYRQFFESGGDRLSQLERDIQRAQQQAEYAATLRVSREALRLWLTQHCGGEPPGFDVVDKPQ